MTGKTKSLSGPAKDKFLTTMLRQHGLDAPQAAALAQSLSTAIREVRVDRALWDAQPRAKKRRGPHGEVRSLAERTSAVPPSATTESAVSVFDPYAFSVVAVFAKKGADALTAELERIARADQLVALATAQHITIDPSETDVAALRRAIVAGAERRLADRRAAAT
jgi:hypothetical protein